MPTYLTVTEARETIERVESVYNDASGSFVSSKLEKVIDDAEAQVAGAIATRYALPVTDSTAIAFIKNLVKPLVRFESYARFAESQEMPENVMVQYKEAMKMIRDLASKRITLPEQSEKTTGRVADLVINFDAPLVGPTDLENY